LWPARRRRRSEWLALVAVAMTVVALTTIAGPALAL
jgi:hypothetical protein